MPHQRDDGRWQFSLKLPEEIQDKIETAAEERRWSRAETVIYLIEDGLEADLVDIDQDRYSNIGNQPVTAATTTDDELVEQVQEIADNDHGGSVNGAVRRIIWSAMQE